MHFPDEHRPLIGSELSALDVRAALKTAIERLREAGVSSHKLAAELLLMHVLKRDRAWLYAHPEESLAPAAAAHFFALVERRSAGEPTQYLTGKQEFWGLEFDVAPGVLIPRPETEHVIEVALERLGPSAFVRPLRVADVGTGSGCLAVALAKELPVARVIATDISATALAIARRNAARHAVASRITFVRCHLLNAFHRPAFDPTGGIEGGEDEGSGVLDLLVSNPPYVARGEAYLLPREVREHEPHEALFAGAHGDELYAPLVLQAHDLLAPGGVLVLEVGYNSCPRLVSLLESRRGWGGVKTTNDLAGIPRVVSASRRE